MAFVNSASPFSFEDVYEQTVESVVRTARALGVAPSSLDDVVQDVFVVVHRKLPEFEGRSTIKTWVTRIVLNVMHEHRRQRAKHHHAEENYENVEGTYASADRVWESKEAAQILLKFLDGLPEPQRVVFVLSELEELTATQIGEMLGESPNTISSRLRLARQEFDRMRQRLRAQEGRENPFPALLSNNPLTEHPLDRGEKA